jgi:hypothetical protein
LVAREDQQHLGEWDETYTSTCRMSAIRLLCALAAEQDLIMHTVDITAAYLHGELNEVVYMRQPV